jgi:hypothetical protein
MSQRYFLISETTYEVLRLNVNAALGYPNQSGTSFLQNPLKAPRDTFRRVLLALDTTLDGAATVESAMATLLQNQLAEELDEATYLAAVAASGGGGGGVSSWNDLTDKPATFPPPVASATVLGGVRVGSGISIDANGVISASAGYTLPAATTSTLGGVIVGSGLSVSSGTVSVITYAVRSDTVSNVSYIGRAVSGTATSAASWRIRRTTVATNGTVTFATATAAAWDDRLTATYS